ncbi:hypothetical protein SEA_MUSETTA_60 [Microbacterium phage Musetta]|nr:hypothetical protein SEA_LYELL_60 [Microbacterium phage Lyell]AXC36282.1 hypothetical protein SEA_FORK_56 [Microbacterium phage Fork]AXH50216.1 hypothetical protein SEA_MUSETTA_60 [Microbacterium phage Musetta]QWS69425.1 hypothetical protein SEA_NECROPHOXINUS_62 [Microbacterium phage Necrophoxinus]QYC54179.1 hypothetical protein SEA_WELCOME_61 [Microbacterium phage Welcome]URM87463.1 hypothetical protein SEA_DUSTYDINO_63 [Microbacterium phage DustyDino]UVK62474.1 hypothetical protein SEA_Y
MTLITPPPSNLGPQSEPWGRYITDQVRQNATAIERLGGDTTNDGIQNNSSLDGLASQINELYQRQSGLIFNPDVVSGSIPGNGGTSTSTINIQVPRPTDKERIGWLSVQFTARANSADSTEIFGSFSLDGLVFHRDSRYVPTENLEPASWNGDKALTGYTGFRASPSSGGLLSLNLEAIASTGAGARTVTYANIRVTYQYGQATT